MATGGPQRIVDTLLKADVRFVANLPESWLVPLVRSLKAHPEIVDIPIASEDEGVGVCAGLELGGKRAALLMQNTGLLASANAITTLSLKHRIPLLMLISHRGAPGRRDDKDYHLLEGEVTHPVLAALRIPVYEVHSSDEVDRIADARERATLGNQPVAVLLTREALAQ